jgi:hypothetical protein
VLRDEQDDTGHGEEEPAWLLNARLEIELRQQAREIGQDEGTLARELHVLARLRATYPDLPPELETQAEGLLRRRWFTEEAWDAVVRRLGTTGWSPRRPGS